MRKSIACALFLARFQVSHALLAPRTRHTPSERAAQLLKEMSLEEKAAQLWQTNYMGGVTDATGLPGGSTRLIQMVRLGIGSQYGLGGPNCSTGGLTNVSCVVAWRNKLQSFVVNNSRLRTPVDFTEETLHAGYHMGAIFPGPIVMGASWNTTLLLEVGAAVAAEARSVGINRGLAPVLQVVTNCRFCRIPESFGEDPHHVSIMSGAYTQAQ
jgi:beta-glucosidase